ncbi:sodium/nucleoside cotransporter 1 isoform X6 [Pseudoliparis swirei]|uniref:sodium/nucleoside cotransporter 1 isoform X6 n=1 Tax=Pseudoliparis swirei TaxID=2059687 RepID=UPI0024BD860C|nr:sodium/nucleoside cotransporter 1 isoform X6 [Pseudoliparis swirei]
MSCTSSERSELHATCLLINDLSHFTFHVQTLFLQCVSRDTVDSRVSEDTMMEADGVKLENVTHYPGNGLDNQAFEREEDIITETNNIQRETKKGLSSCLSLFSKPINAAEDYFKAHSQTFKVIVLGILGAGYVAYFIAACVLDFQRAIALVVLTSLAIVAKSYELLKEYKGESISQCFRPAARCFKSNFKWLKWVLILAAVVLLVLWLVLDTSQRPEQLISFGGVCMFVMLVFLLSAHRKAVSWRPVFWGLGMQFCIGLFVIRTQLGLISFKWLGKQVEIFLAYTKEGSSFVFGDLIGNIFAFQIFLLQVLPIVVFFSSVMSILYFLGIMQWLILKIAWCMQITMGTSPTETLSVAGNIFVGQTEAPLLIRPYLKDMTKSEIHAVMTGGFATIAGSVLGAFISFGIDSSSLISASVMAAPCALAISKLSYPETEESPFKDKKNIKVSSGDEKNILEAASSGASASIGLVANIAANLIAFLAILGFINATLKWLGGMVGYPSISFQVRSEIITTYALCGFANLSSLGIMIGGLTSICPSRRSDVSALVMRSMLTATCVSLINACIAGILFVPPLDCVELFNTTAFNNTNVNMQTCCTDLFQSTVNNGTISFEGWWSSVANVTLYFSKCCQCCGLSDVAVCN